MHKKTDWHSKTDTVQQKQHKQLILTNSKDIFT